MKIVDAIPNVTKYPTIYIGQRIKKDADGAPVLEHGRTVTEDVAGSSYRVVMKFRFLVEGQTKGGTIQEWMSDAELSNKVGKKKYRAMVKHFLSSDKGHKIMESVNG